MKTVLSLVLMILSVTTYSQNKYIQFETKTFAEIKALAKAQNKLIFLDAYTSWCGPCKYMAKNIFTNDTVADFYNSRFINAKIDMEKGEGVELWDMINKYRNDLVKKVGTYSPPGGKVFSITPKGINTFKDNNDLTAQVTKMVKGSKCNWNDDGEKLIEIYMSLTKAERVTSGDIEGVHWMGKTFDHAPLVAALASLRTSPRVRDTIASTIFSFPSMSVTKYKRLPSALQAMSRSRDGGEVTRATGDFSSMLRTKTSP